jgi:hypothetical protein
VARKISFKFLDLGKMPLANNFLTEKELESFDEPRYPLDLFFVITAALSR